MAKPTYKQLEQQIIDAEEDNRTLNELEKALRESRDRYQRLVEAVTSYIYSVKVENGRPVETLHRQPCEVVTGYSTEDFQSDPYLWIKMVPVEDHQTVNDQISAIMSGIKSRAIEHRIFRKDGSTRWVSNTPVPQYDGTGNLISYDGVICDITERKEIENEKEKLINELRTALDEIKTLRGILPLCSFCKKIRDDEGYWERVDVYIHRHSQAEISHSVCPECMKKHYQEYL